VVKNLEVSELTEMGLNVVDLTHDTVAWIALSAVKCD